MVHNNLIAASRLELIVHTAIVIEIIIRSLHSALAIGTNGTMGIQRKSFTTLNTGPPFTPLAVSGRTITTFMAATRIIFTSHTKPSAFCDAGNKLSKTVLHDVAVVVALAGLDFPPRMQASTVPRVRELANNRAFPTRYQTRLNPPLEPRDLGHHDTPPHLTPKGLSSNPLTRRTLSPK